jgi:Ni/Fe-hydrogenase subunit HybB-like protein
MAVIIIPVAVSVHTIISWILATTVQPGWHSSIFGPYFVVGAIFSGIGALFLAMSAVRRALGLEAYITLRQYRNLGLLFIVMNLIWFYFTYAEHLGIAAAQQLDEFVVLASKFWGEFAAGFWVMIALMAVSLWILVGPRLLGAVSWSRRLARPELTIASAAGVFVTLLFLVSPLVSWLQPLQLSAALDDPVSRTAAWALLIFFAFGIGVGAAPWLRAHPVSSTVIAAVLVVIGMWLERWNIIVPTMTHPRLIPFATYLPTATELSLTAASVALFMLLFLLFFKLFPAVSLWEVAEGRVVEEAHSRISIPEPESSQVKRGLRWIQRRLG